MSIKLEHHADTPQLRRLVGHGVTGAWTHTIPELRVGNQRFIYLGDEILECTALTRCAKCHNAWGDFSLCPACAETAKRCAVARNKRLSAFQHLRDQSPRHIPDSLVWQMVDTIEELATAPATR